MSWPICDFECGIACARRASWSRFSRRLASRSEVFEFLEPRFRDDGEPRAAEQRAHDLLGSVTEACRRHRHSKLVRFRQLPRPTLERARRRPRRRVDGMKWPTLKST